MFDETVNPYAIQVDKGYKYYGSSKDKFVVLNQLDMKVEYGTIYGLLGASGCGKTTLISSLAGLKSLGGGELHVLGTKSDKNHTEVIGPRIGYMPQESALIHKLSIKENIYYFGLLYNMDSCDIRERFMFLSELLELPPEYLDPVDCSGGEQRRVSFAISIVHSPDLLLLDEPTVGLDPLLRKKIWDFLVEEVHTKKVTVLLSTHYIEEARQATKVGLMYHGTILVEDSPINLMNNLGAGSLEEAFVVLRTKKDICLNYNSLFKADNLSNNNCMNLENKIKRLSMKEESIIYKTDFSRSLARIEALFIKNIKQILRQPWFLFVYLLLSIASFFLFYLSVGADPTGLKIGVFNQEMDDLSECNNGSTVKIKRTEDGCEWEKVSCLFLNKIDEELTKVYYSTWKDGYTAVKMGEVTGVLNIHYNFSNALHETFIKVKDVDDDTLYMKEIDVHLDQSNVYIDYYMKRKMFKAYKLFAEELMRKCNYSTALLKLPVHFEEPIYGSHDETFTSYVLPGILVTWVFSFAMMFSMNAFVDDKGSGIWNRVLATGTRPSEWVIAYLIVLVMMMALQGCTIFIIEFFVLERPNKGSHILVISLLMLNGFLGIWIGLVSSVFFNSSRASTNFGVGFYFSMVIMSGIVRPIENAIYFLQKIFYIVPIGTTGAAIRDIVNKGYSLKNASVLIGFANLVCWTIAMIALFLVVFKRMK